MIKVMKRTQGRGTCLLVRRLAEAFNWSIGLNHEKKNFFDIKYDLLKNCIINE